MARLLSRLKTAFGKEVRPGSGPQMVSCLIDLPSKSDVL